MRRFALKVAMYGCLVLAGISLASGVPTFDAAVRAVIGAVVLYFVVSICGKLALGIVVDAVVNSVAKSERNRDTEQ